MPVKNGHMSGKIAYLTGEYPRATDTFIQREVAGLRALGIQIETCSIRRTSVDHLVGDEQKLEAQNTFYVLAQAKRPLRLIAAHIGGLARNPIGYFKTLALAYQTRPLGVKGTLYQLFYFTEAIVLAAHLRERKIAHLHNHIAKSSCSVAMLASHFSGVPYSFTLHGPDIFFDPMHWRLDEKIKRAAFVSCISHYCRSQAMIWSRPADWDKLHIVHCGVDPARYKTAKTVQNSTPKLTFVGRLAAVKGLPILFEALNILSDRGVDFELDVIGDGPDRAALEDVAQSGALQGKINFLGYKSQSDVAELLAQSDVFVLPSFAEGLPVVLMEALAASVPVVATQIAGVSELVQDGISGYLVPAGDASALADKLAILMHDPKLRSKMGKTGVKIVAQEFDISKETSRLAALFKSYHLGHKITGIRPRGCDE